MFAALSCAATMVIQIPIATGYLNFGDGLCLLAGWILGPWYGFAAGSALAVLLAAAMTFALTGCSVRELHIGQVEVNTGAGTAWITPARGVDRFDIPAADFSAGADGSVTYTGTAYRVLQAREKLQRENQREPTVEQIAKELDLPREEVVFAMDAVVDPVSLFDPVYSDGGDTVCVMDQVRVPVTGSVAEDTLLRSARSGGQALAARAAYFSHALLRRQDADGGLR